MFVGPRPNDYATMYKPFGQLYFTWYWRNAWLTGYFVGFLFWLYALSQQ